MPPRGTTQVRIRQTDKRRLEMLQLPGQSIADVLHEAVKVLFFHRMNEAARHLKEVETEEATPIPPYVPPPGMTRCLSCGAYIAQGLMCNCLRITLDKTTQYAKIPMPPGHDDPK